MPPPSASRYGLDTILKVYGVGDHGGGPTRRDLERILDMDTWPVFPSLRFGTFAEFFAGVEKVADRPARGERRAELHLHRLLHQPEPDQAGQPPGRGGPERRPRPSASLAALQRRTVPGRSRLPKAWQNTLFNQFHDIIPGSGIIDTREYALGLFQQTMALASSQKNRAFRALTAPDRPARKQRADSLASSIAEGAGVGFGVDEFKITQVSRGGGKKRLFHLFNPSPWPRREVVEAAGVGLGWRPGAPGLPG